MAYTDHLHWILMTTTRVLLLLLIGALGGGLLVGSGFGRPVLQFFGLEPQPLPAELDTAESPAAVAPAAPESVAQAPLPSTEELELSTLERALEWTAPVQRQSLLSDPQAFRQFVAREALSHSVLRAARDNGVDREAQIAFLMQRNAQRVLAEHYLHRVLEANLPVDYPGEEQILEHYRDHQDRYSRPERIQLWQIYLAAGEGMPEEEVETVERRSQDLVGALKAGEESFAAVAAVHSEHEASRSHGGYMGLIDTSELLPEVREAVLAVGEGEIAGPLRTATGFHIVKRGPLIPGEPLPLEKVQAQIRHQLAEENRLRVREAVLAKIAETYPVSIDEDDLGRWREQLIERFQAPEPEGDGR